MEGLRLLSNGEKAKGNKMRKPVTVTSEQSMWPDS